MALKIFAHLASIMVAYSLPAREQSSTPDQNMKIGLYSGISTALELPSMNAMDNEIIINQKGNKIAGNNKLIVNQIDNVIFGNSNIVVNQEDNKIGGKGPIFMNIDGNNITGNSSVDVNQDRNQIGLYYKESDKKPPIPVTIAEPTTTTSDKKPPIPVTIAEPTTTTSDKTPPIPVTIAEPTTTTSDITPSVPVSTAEPTTVTSHEQRCTQAGGFMMRAQCFKFFPDEEISWEEAKEKCEDEHFILAEPSDDAAVPLRKYILDTYGNRKESWLGARGTGTDYRWLHSGKSLLPDNPLWNNRQRLDNSYCLELDVWQKGWDADPNQPYGSSYCTFLRYLLCEVL